MTRREWLRALLERGVAHLWLTALVVVVLRITILPGRAVEADIEPGHPAWCEVTDRSSAGVCRWRDMELVMHWPNDDDGEIHYLVRRFGASGADVIPIPPTVPESELLAAHGLDAPEHVAGAGLCEDRADEGALRVAEPSQLDACTSVVGGPYDDQGLPVAARVLPPVVSLWPALSIDEELLDFIALRQRFNGSYRPLQALEGRAFGGWLLLPLTDLNIPAERLPGALHLLTRAASAIGDRPFPDPVVLDLAGLSVCPTPGALPVVMGEIEGLGLTTIGARSAREADSDLRLYPLSREGRTIARVVSARVTLGPEPCRTLATVSPVELCEQVAAALSVDDDLVPTVILLHLPDDSVSDEALQVALDELAELPVPLVVAIYRTKAAGSLAAAANGPRILDMGSLLHKDSLMPAAVRPSGWVVQCFRPTAEKMLCTPRLLAGVFGDALPLAGGHCNACAFLPASLDEFTQP